MQPSRAQTTIAAPCSLSGRGYWSGKLNTLTFLPAKAGTGIQFERADFAHAAPVTAVAENCQGMALRTQLSAGMLQFDMVEHVMSALYGLGIDNVRVRCTEAEMPGFDGSSHAIALALDSAGIVELPEQRTVITLTDAVQVGNGDAYVKFEPSRETAGLQFRYELDYGPDSPIGVQSCVGTLNWDAESRQSYLQEIAPCRTFVTEGDAERLQQSGVAQHVTQRDLLVFGATGPIMNELRFENECARHKALDLIGDIAMVGVDLHGQLIARKSGHQLNGELANLLRAKVNQVHSDAQRQVA